jgi:serine/threonine-protein kinase
MAAGMLRRMSSAPGPVDALGLVGSTIDQVRFDACVDAGGFGLIYRGFHQGLGETVAIKCLRIASIQKTNEEIREALAGRFRDETKLLYRLSQGNLDIVRCISSGTLVAPRTNEYTPYMVLEWLDGCTLSVELKERRLQRMRSRTLEETVSLLDPAAGGLAYAHAHDVVHRDVKPGNLFLTRTREGVRMKVLDFGLAKILSDESIGVRPSVETGIGVHFCSPSYGAPEQFSAQIGKIGPWTDVYSLALVLFEVMTGEKVRPAGSLADGLLKAIDPKTGSPSASSLGLHVPVAVEELLLRAVAQNPLDRPRDAGVFWSALKEAIATAPRPLANMNTVTDDSVRAAMQQVRAAVGNSMQPAPFMGTMVMRAAPAGAPHVGTPMGSLPAPIPAAGRAPEASGGTGTQPTEPPMVSRSTAPLASPASPAASIPPPPGPDSMVLARQRGELLKGTMPIGAMSPLAASMAVPSPLRNAPSAPPPPMQQQAPHGQQAQLAQQGQHGPHGQQPSHAQAGQAAHAGASGMPSPYGSQPPQQHPSQPATVDPRHLRTDPRMGSEAPLVVPTRSNAVTIAVVVACLVIALAGAALYLVRMRGH